MERVTLLAGIHSIATLDSRIPSAAIYRSRERPWKNFSGDYCGMGLGLGLHEFPTVRLGLLSDKRSFSVCASGGLSWIFVLTRQFDKQGCNNEMW